MTERMYRVTFPDGEQANVYARGLSVAWGTEEGKRRRAGGEDWGCFGGLDMDVEMCQAFREMSVDRQTEESPKCDFRQVCVWLMGPDERLLVGDLVEIQTEHTAIAQGFFDRQSQENWAAAKLELVHD